MFAFLLMMDLAVAQESYATESLHAFVALANDRIVDGVSYTDGDGVLAAGALHSHPSGFFFSSELAGFDGDGGAMPDTSIMTLNTAAGWRLERGSNAFSLAVLDYRLNSAGLNDDSHDHQGATLNYRRGALTLEFGVEPDAPYYFHPDNVFYPYDIRRGAISWTQPMTTDWRWSVGVGSQHFEQSRLQHDFATASVVWRWQELEWQFSVTRASGNLPFGGGAADGVHVLLRIAKPFRLQ